MIAFISIIVRLLSMRRGIVTTRRVFTIFHLRQCLIFGETGFPPVIAYAVFRSTVKLFSPGDEVQIAWTNSEVNPVERASFPIVKTHNIFF